MAVTRSCWDREPAAYVVHVLPADTLLPELGELHVVHVVLARHVCSASLTDQRGLEGNGLAVERFSQAVMCHACGDAYTSTTISRIACISRIHVTKRFEWRCVWQRLSLLHPRQRLSSHRVERLISDGATPLQQVRLS